MGRATDLRASILAKIPSLPPVFDAKTVLVAIGAPSCQIGIVRRVIKQLASEGRIFESRVFSSDRHGHPNRWSATPGITEEALVETLVISVIGQMPRHFRPREVLAAIRAPTRLADAVVDVLDSLAQEGKVGRVHVPLVGRPGRTNSIWTTDEKEIASEARLEKIMAQKREIDEAQRRDVLARLARPIDDEGSA